MIYLLIGRVVKLQTCTRIIFLAMVAKKGPPKTVNGEKRKLELEWSTVSHYGRSNKYIFKSNV